MKIIHNPTLAYKVFDYLISINPVNSKILEFTIEISEYIENINDGLFDIDCIYFSTDDMKKFMFDFDEYMICYPLTIKKLVISAVKHDIAINQPYDLRLN